MDRPSSRERAVEKGITSSIRRCKCFEGVGNLIELEVDLMRSLVHLLSI